MEWITTPLTCELAIYLSTKDDGQAPLKLAFMVSILLGQHNSSITHYRLSPQPTVKDVFSNSPRS